MSPGFGLYSYWPFPAALWGLHSVPCFCLSARGLVILRSYWALSCTQFWDWVLSKCFYVLDYVSLSVCVCTPTHISMYSFYINRCINTCVTVFYDRLLLCRHMNILIYFIILPWDESDTYSSFFWIQGNQISKVISACSQNIASLIPSAVLKV